MKIVFVNSILKTPEHRSIPEIKSIKDTLVYNFCLAFKKNGHDVTLLTARDFKPVGTEEYDIDVRFFKSVFKKVFRPAVFPFHPGLILYLLKNKRKIDLVISSEIFSLNSFISAILVREKLIVWHELAKHTRMFFRLPSLFWYSVIVPLFFNRILIVPRSVRTQRFAKRYCSFVSERIISHGADIERFRIGKKRDDLFLAIAQLVKRKNIESIVRKFGKFLPAHSGFILVVIGDGPERKNLLDLASVLGISSNIEFRGFLDHEHIVKLLARAKGLLIDTHRDNSVLMIPEAVSCAVPILTNTVPDNSYLVSDHELGIVRDNWDEGDMEILLTKNEYFIGRCIGYRGKLSLDYLAREMINIYLFSKRYELEQVQRKRL